MPERVRLALWAVVLLSLLPAAWLIGLRLGAEDGTREIAIVMDHDALRTQAAALGRDTFELARHYRSLGLPGIALYERTPESMAQSGQAAAAYGADLIAASLAAGEGVPELPPDATLVHEIQDGATDRMVAAAAEPPARVSVADQDWWAFPGDVMELQPGGPDQNRVERYADAGFDLAYRPRNIPGLRDVGSDFPAEARYLVHAGLDVAGHPHDPSGLVEASQPYLTAIIEGTAQDGFDALRGKVPTVRLLSFNQDYVNRRLAPQELVDKYLLAASERNVRLLYLRPYTEQQQGDMLANTEAVITGLRRALAAEGFTVAPLPTDRDRIEGYAPPHALRLAATLGIVAGVALLAGLFPAGWGLAVVAALALLCLAAGGLDYDTPALAAALAFPVLGYATQGTRRLAWLRATIVTLVGAALLVAVGSDRASLLALAPFRGVAATLVVPPALYLAYAMLRERGAGAWLRTLWTQPIRVGPAALVLVGLAGLALVVIRRGNTPLIGASALELEIRELLSQWFARPRFKELLGHPMAVLGLGGEGWPAWIRAPLLTGGVIAQASILNSFAHYHTPLSVSLERTGVALLIGIGTGYLLVPVARLAVRGGRSWLARA